MEEEYKGNREKDIAKVKKQKEEKDKRLLKMEVIMGVCATIIFLTSIIIASFLNIQNSIRLTIIIALLVFAFIIVLLMIRIEQKAGYYECRKCGHKYVPTYISVLCAPHINRTRYMRCPKCNKKSWQKKVISK